MQDVNPKWRFRLQVWKPYYGDARQWEYVVIDTSAMAGPSRVKRRGTSPDWIWRDALEIGLFEMFRAECNGS